MGEVYRARDERLGRDVAVKILKREFAADRDRLRRFASEARAMASVSHPNIVAVHDVGTSEGMPFIVTELLEGESLRDRVRNGALTVATAVDYAIQITHGLEAAHACGIVHRDLKSENVFLTRDGQIKLLDFGIATLVETDPERTGGAGSRHERWEDTHPGDLAGTPGCMSPEQIRGLPADQRVDIFATGVVLFEMLAGRRPFRGGTTGETMSLVLNDDPPPLGRSVPEPVRRIVARCLEKRPEDRFSSAHDLALALGAVGGGRSPAWIDRARPRREDTGRWRLARPGLLTVWVATAVVAIVAITVYGYRYGYRFMAQTSEPRPPSTNLNPHRIAVVPFVDPGNGDDIEPLGMLAALRLSMALATLHEVEVIRTEESSAYPIGVAGEGPTVAEATGAGLVLGGSVNRLGDEVEFSAVLEDEANGQIVRVFEPVSSTSDRAATALEMLCDQVLIAVQEHLHPSLGFGAGDRFPRIDAYDEYRKSLEVAGSAPLEDAFRHVERALALDPDFVQARLVWAGALTFVRPEAVDRTLALARLPRLLPVDRSRMSILQEWILDGILFRIDGNWQGALQLFQNVLARDPRNCITRMYVIDCAVRANRPQRAVEAFEGMTWDPIQPPQANEIAVSGAATAYHLVGRHDEELDVAEQLGSSSVLKNARLWASSRELKALAAAGRLERLELAIESALVEPAAVPFQHARVMIATATELREHGHPQAAIRVAERALDEIDQSEPDDTSAFGLVECRLDAMYLAGDAERAYAMVLESAKQWPDSFERSKVIGLAAARAGDADVALQQMFALSRFDRQFTFGEADYVRARIAALIGDRDEALRLLRRAIINGFSDYSALHCCPDLEPLWQDPEFRRLIRPKV